jgi:Tol biopolymer transport system component
LLFFRHSTRNKDGSSQFIEPGLYRLDLRRGLVSEMPFQGSWEWLKNYPAASPDGSRLAVWTELAGKRQLAVLSLDPSGLGGSQLTPLGVDGSSPTWSSDGEWIAFTAPGVDPAGDPLVQVNIIRPDGSGLQQIFTWGSTPSLAWAPDSPRLLITAWPTGEDPEHDRTTFYIASLPDGRLQHIFVDDAERRYELISPAFRPPD